MGRRINSRLKVTGNLVAETPLHVGGYGDSPDTDLPLAQNGKGEWYVPGTSIAGVLRNWVLKNFGHLQIQNDKKFVEEVFGFQEADKGQASFVLIEDATIEDAAEVLSEIRDGVGIDRFYGTAADGAKYDRAVLPRGTQLDFEMRVEIGEGHDAGQTKAVIGFLLEDLAKSNVRFGASKTRGLGRVRLENFSIKEQSFIGFEILDTLNDGGNLLTLEQLKNKSISPSSDTKLVIEIDWKPRLPVMVKAGYDGIGVDMLPLTSGVRNGELALVLPGSSIKGVMRSHAERIVRTLKGLSAPNNPNDNQNFNNQVDVPLVDELFGARSKSKDEASIAKKDLGLGALAIDDCYATEGMNTDAWREVEIAKADNEQSFGSWELTEKLAAIPNTNLRINHHVAIDRWTGGASEGALYSVLTPTKIVWEAMRLSLGFGRIEKESRLPALMLLLLILRDIAENRLSFGFATNRGMGEIEVETLRLKGSGFENQLSCLNTSSEDGLVLSKGKFTDLDKGLKEKLKTEWETWCNNQ